MRFTELWQVSVVLQSVMLITEFVIFQLKNCSVENIVIELDLMKEHGKDY